MAKKFAHKQDKRLLTEAQIKELGLQKGDFTESWQGRVFVNDAQNSHIATEMGIKRKGEYAIKIR
ncbi:DNA-directed RNA polymerase subunit E'' [archaeon]|nr:DNA-directed RNA polymerase subunit E'' [archaeon]|tara:strand:- start:3622 stop:3816 length:195 start_codon:yes stop_codon:yes gene_type:complete